MRPRVLGTEPSSPCRFSVSVGSPMPCFGALWPHGPGLHPGRAPAIPDSPALTVGRVQDPGSSREGPVSGTAELPAYHLGIRTTEGMPIGWEIGLLKDVLSSFRGNPLSRSL